MAGLVRIRLICSTVAVVVIIIAAIVGEFTALPAAKTAAAAATVVFMLLEAVALTRGGHIMLAFCLAATVVTLAIHPHGGEVVMHGLNSAAFVIGLFAAVSLLRDAAETSPLIQRCGDVMVRQPPGRRYTVLSVGSHLIAVILNFGVLTLLGVMVQRGNTLDAAGGDQRIADIRKQRMMTALLQGFAMMTVWSPLSVSFAVMQAAIPGVDLAHLLPVQGVLTVLLLLLGWAIDRLTFPPGLRGTITTPLPKPAEPPSWAPMGQLVLLVGSVITAVLGMAWLLDIRPVISAMVVVPISAWLWLAVQVWHSSPLLAPVLATRRLARRLEISMPAFRTEFAVLGGATFFGAVAAAYLTPSTIADLLAHVALPPILLTIALVWGMMVAARYGVPQIVSATLIGNGLSGLATHGIHPLVLTSGLMGAWALSACTTPVGAATLSIARQSGVSTKVVGRDWNGRFVLSGSVVVAVWMVVLRAFLH
ncbi:hypothetical protein [Insolitispirillum peregrinum]|uniref:Di-and tricarboxylate transporter n=1 Tax=Insolitispirillum peregrinum TaxID=80876 RepID=A0A1N7KCY9_9PROT|nr:hypothetical protein [Insolitispirillum peregrinum]SIS59465.1 hypothetical protein SAMN05421779_102713 [Insolitispirillum peregrinum]